MAYPARYHIEALQKLRGDAYVTFPTSDLSVRTVERVYSVPREKAADPDSFNSPQTFEYTDTQLTEQHFVGGDAIYVEVYQKWETLPGSALITRSIGQPSSLIPEKYRRLIRTVETNQSVGPDYVMPTGLTGDQTFIQLAMETVAKLRLKIIEEKINFDETPLVSGKTGEFGNLIINEEIVDEGTAPLTGELIQSSDVQALGNGKAIRITVRYPSNLFTLQKVTRSVGVPDSVIPQKYRRLIRHVETEKPVPVDYTFPSGLTGDQTFIEFAQKTITEARLRIIEEKINTDETPLIGGKTGEFGNLIVLEEVVDEGTLPLSGQLIQHSEVDPLGNGKAIRITLKYPSNLFDLQKVSKTIGTPESLIPVKYRRLIRTVETEKPVPVDYAFPSGLVGDQTFIEFAQKTITEARLKIHEEVILTDEAPLEGGETDDYGKLVIYETVVEEGTAPDEGFFYKRSTVTPLGNGKAIKITVKYRSAVVATVIITAGGSGYTDGTTAALSFSSGDAAGTYTVENGHVVRAVITVGGTYTTLPTVTFPPAFGGGGATGIVLLGQSRLNGSKYDEEMQVSYPESRQLIQAVTEAQAGLIGTQAAAGERKEVQGQDKFRAILIRSLKTPTAVDVASAIVSDVYRPYRFPGRFDIYSAFGLGGFQSVRRYQRPVAELVQILVKTYWVNSSTKPSIAGIAQIFPDSITLIESNPTGGSTPVERSYENVLHDAGYFLGAGILGATTPSFSEYTGLGAPTALTGTIAFTDGSNAVVGTGTMFTTEVDVGDLLNGVMPVTAITDDTHLTVSAGVPTFGGAATGLDAWIRPYDSGTAWIGSLKIIGGSVTPTGQARQWKIETQSVVMR